MVSPRAARTGQRQGRHGPNEKDFADHLDFLPKMAPGGFPAFGGALLHVICAFVKPCSDNGSEESVEAPSGFQSMNFDIESLAAILVAD